MQGSQWVKDSLRSRRVSQSVATGRPGDGKIRQRVGRGGEGVGETFLCVCKPLTSTESAGVVNRTEAQLQAAVVAATRLIDQSELSSLHNTTGRSGCLSVGCIASMTVVMSLACYTLQPMLLLM